ncbi:hypothetical protein [Mogibacterium diversum]|uniref:hypothetical protein n=1 Tax=Mogibacterium diversum TaxID=114527 RepID=UPI0026F1F33B|nr:hypothetical protein [Mogibacterium diversum]
MSNINFLLIDDESEQEEIFKSAIDEINAENTSNNLTYKAVKTPEEAMVELYKNYFQAIIMDLKLTNDDNTSNDDEQISGNILLNQIIQKEIIPIVVRTGFPSKVSDNINQRIVKVLSKDVPLYDVIKELIEKYSDSVFKIFGSRGEINNNIKELFWEVMPIYFANEDNDISPLPQDKQETVIIRYISSWFSNKYMFDEKYIDVEPIEMYMFPNPILQVCTCDIYKKNISEDNYEYFIVLTPSCDLANKKVDEVILCKIKKHDEIQSFVDQLNCYNNESNKNSKKAKNAKLSLAKWFRNSHPESMRYHFLPKVNNFTGGFVDFRSIISLKYDKDSGEINNEEYSKVGVITESFKRDIVSRFSAYYQRQGQPTFNTDSILEKYF